MNLPLGHMRKKELIEAIREMGYDSDWNCYTKEALRRFWSFFSKDAVAVVYADVDDMHGLNERPGIGHAGTDRQIAAVIGKIRHESKTRHGDIVASRWLKGDELVFLLGSGDPLHFCERMQLEFAAYGIRLTMAYSYVVTRSAFETVNPLDGKVQASKNRNKRGVIVK